MVEVTNLKLFISSDFLHRDLKLDNFLLDSEGNIKLADFGISYVFETDEKLTKFGGTGGYVAPEVKAHKPYDGPKADVYSLGVCLFGMITGRFPFHPDTGVYL